MFEHKKFAESDISYIIHYRRTVGSLYLTITLSPSHLFLQCAQGTGAVELLEETRDSKVQLLALSYTV